MVHWIPLPPFASDVHRIVYARGIFFLCIALRIEEALSDPSSLYKAGVDLVVTALHDMTACRIVAEQLPTLS